MVTSCEIKFDNSANNTFMSGQLVSGRIILNLTEKKKIRCEFLITFNFVNSAIVLGCGIDKKTQECSSACTNKFLLSAMKFVIFSYI